MADGESSGEMARRIADSARIGKNLESARVARGLSREELVSLVNQQGGDRLTVQQLKQYERGENMIRALTIWRLRFLFEGNDVGQFFDGLEP